MLIMGVTGHLNDIAAPTAVHAATILAATSRNLVFTAILTSQTGQHHQPVHEVKSESNIKRNDNSLRKIIHGPVGAIIILYGVPMTVVVRIVKVIVVRIVNVIIVWIVSA
jgi:hypothetical protein